jgi:SAM-dependent methyltransferase
MNEQKHHDQFYEVDADRLLSRPLFVRVHQRAARDLCRRAGLGPTSEVLSLGCGDGAIECILAPRVKHITGLEISPLGVERARRKAAAAGVANLTYEVADLTQWQPAEQRGTYDAVCAFAFFHHISEDAILRLLEASRSMLKPGGMCYNSDPSSRRLVSRFAGVVRRTFNRYHTEEERELTPERLCALYRRAGFVDPHVSYFDYFTGPVAWLVSPPQWMSWGLDCFDQFLVRVPGLRRFASSFTVTGRAPM